jgi:hypothetical protein
VTADPSIAVTYGVRELLDEMRVDIKGARSEIGALNLRVANVEAGLAALEGRWRETVQTRRWQIATGVSLLVVIVMIAGLILTAALR